MNVNTCFSHDSVRFFSSLLFCLQFTKSGQSVKRRLREGCMQGKQAVRSYTQQTRTTPTTTISTIDKKERDWMSCENPPPNSTDNETACSFFSLLLLLHISLSLLPKVSRSLARSFIPSVGRVSARSLLHCSLEGVKTECLPACQPAYLSVCPVWSRRFLRWLRTQAGSSTHAHIHAHAKDMYREKERCSSPTKCYYLLCVEKMRERVSVFFSCFFLGFYYDKSMLSLLLGRSVSVSLSVCLSVRRMVIWVTVQEERWGNRRTKLRS